MAQKKKSAGKKAASKRKGSDDTCPRKPRPCPGGPRHLKLPFAEPDPAGSERARRAKAIRDLATEVSRINPQALTRTNAEEQDHGPQYPANFTKGLAHDKFGLLACAEDYRNYVEAINAPDPTLFEKLVRSAVDRGVKFSCARRDTCKNAEGEIVARPLQWRGWESPRAGHVYELQGPDAGAVGMAPAPRVGSSELAAEMAEVYGLAILRDVPFSEIRKGKGTRIDGGRAVLTADRVVKHLNEMEYFCGPTRTSSTPSMVDGSCLNRFERNRRAARNPQNPKCDPDGMPCDPLRTPLTAHSAFRGSTWGSHQGPYISQFMLIGTPSLAGDGGGMSSFPQTSACYDLQDGFIGYGSINIDQRALVHRECVDYMTDWCSWLDVQNGANFKGADRFETKRRFITTPRDLATYVHFDALYEAYLNAGLILLGLGVPHSKGFPEPSPSERRDAFATFGGPHILSLVTEVATRCLKAVRRQKFNYHRRARPETLGGRLTLSALGLGSKLGSSGDAFADTLREIPPALRKAVIKHNELQNDLPPTARLVACNNSCVPKELSEYEKANLLLPMAFPEGSPMHPAYGAGHATVAGGCVTMLKAFFEMFKDGDSGEERLLQDPWGNPIAYEPNAQGTKLVQDPGKPELTIQGELDKLAANISIGRNMAGVHYYSDYYDSLRMGERIAVGILLEQAPTYGDYVESTFTSFDGDLVTISGEGGSCPSLSILDAEGCAVDPRDWWLRHVSGQELSEDL